MARLRLLKNQLKVHTNFSMASIKFFTNANSVFHSFDITKFLNSIIQYVIRYRRRFVDDSRECYTAILFVIHYLCYDAVFKSGEYIELYKEMFGNSTNRCDFEITARPDILLNFMRRKPASPHMYILINIDNAAEIKDSKLN